MTLAEFRNTLSEAMPPALARPALLALWHDGRDDWEAAHRIAQDIDDVTGSWVHAYLHRKEGDASNAAYWYRRAGQPVPRASLAEEWSSIVETLLSST